MIPMMVFISTVNNSPDPIQALFNYGLGGAVIALFALGVFRSSKEVKYLQDENKELRSIIRNFQIQMTTHTIPAMERNVQVLEAIPDKESAMLKVLQDTQKEMLDVMGRLEKFSTNGS